MDQQPRDESPEPAHGRRLGPALQRDVGKARLRAQGGLQLELDQPAGRQALARRGQDAEVDRLRALDGSDQAVDLLALQRDHQLRIGGRAVLLDQQPRHLVGQRGRRDRIAQQLLKTDAGLAGERMVGAADEAGRLVAERVDLQVGRGCHPARIDHQRVELARAQLQQLQLGRATGDRHPQVGMLLGRMAQQRGRQQCARARTQADPDRAATALQPFRAAPELGRLEQDAARARHHLAAERGQLVALADAVEQLAAERLLEVLDAAAQRRLGQAALLGGAAEGAGIGQCQQMFEGLEVHAMSFY